MIIIGYNYEGFPISIISCKSIKNARAYWQGAGITPHSEKIFTIDEDRENEKEGYVTPILKTKQIMVASADWTHKEYKILTIDK